MRRFLGIRVRSLPALAFGLAVLHAGPAHAQRYQVARPTYVVPPPQVAQPTYVVPSPRIVQPRGGVFLSGPDLRRPRPWATSPYSRSPYTDDWSTGRNMPYPKPWMIPRR